MRVRRIEELEQGTDTMMRVNAELVAELETMEQENTDYWIIRLEEAGYAVGIRMLELLCHREKVSLISQLPKSPARLQLRAINSTCR